MMTDEEIYEALNSAGIRCELAFGSAYTGNVQLRAFARAVEVAVIEKCAVIADFADAYGTAVAIRSLLKGDAP